MRVFTRFDELASTEETNHLLQYLARVLSLRIDDQLLQERILGLLARDAWREICQFELHYDALSASDAFNLGQIRAFFSKRQDLDLGVDRSAVAAEKFKLAEAECRETNRLFHLRSEGAFSFPPRVERTFCAMQRKISQILGDIPSLDQLDPRFGSGANTNITKARACPRNKLGLELQASRELLPYVSAVLEEMPGWTRMGSEGPSLEVPLPEVSESFGKVEFVPKSWKTDRAIVKEPLLNTMWQLGIGDYMVDRLSKWGCDLIHGQDVNRRKAKESSLTGALATLDLSSASDTISQYLVYELLPEPWFELLARFRTSRVDLNGRIVIQEKFSSMGNGFTFPLETLIFYALCSAVSAECYVYGDDLIVESGSVEILTECLRCFGFTVNPDKSFSTGCFRESCGGDYLSGIDVRPCFVKSNLACSDLFVLRNFFWARFDYATCDILTSRVAPHLRIMGPPGYGDGHLHADGCSRPRGRKHGWGVYTFDTFQLLPMRSFSPSRGDSVLPCYSIYASDPKQKRQRSYLRIPRRNGGNSQGSLSLTFVEAPPQHGEFSEDGSYSVVLPNTDGYRRISIVVPSLL